MSVINFFIDFVLHIDTHLISIVTNFGNWTYLILFFIIFIETGAVILPFLPGDSLLFAASALAANSIYHLNIWIFVGLFLAAAYLGDSLNFFIGKKVGSSVSEHAVFGKLINQDNLNRTEQFFNKHGGPAIILARFMPIIRTFAPFIVGGSGFKYSRFLRFSLIGGFSWVTICCSAGFFFGNIPAVQDHFSLVVLGIILISLIPAVFGGLKAKFSK
ncbi:Protein DedA [Dellaglioa algida]|uniref:DedA family membrane protein n=2 Tax=Dellaglioa algida TaxID=105612 RepID=A0A0R1HFP5_9LACO|nr:DedA family membrane protein [Dellaglioa algida DSM 15638]TWW10935.1 membrane protein [Dellaglioa algida]SOB51905.1 Protein DedA [Dellaglioa algida]